MRGRPIGRRLPWALARVCPAAGAQPPTTQAPHCAQECEEATAAEATVRARRASRRDRRRLAGPFGCRNSRSRLVVRCERSCRRHGCGGGQGWGDLLTQPRPLLNSRSHPRVDLVHQAVRVAALPGLAAACELDAGSSRHVTRHEVDGVVALPPGLQCVHVIAYADTGAQRPQSRRGRAATRRSSDRLRVRLASSVACRHSGASSAVRRGDHHRVAKRGLQTPAAARSARPNSGEAGRDGAAVMHAAHLAHRAV